MNQATKQPSNPATQILPGWVAPYYVRYGNHRLGPYHVRIWKKHGKLHKEYIKPADLEKVKAATERHRQKRISIIRAGKELRTVAGNLNYILRMVKRSLKGLLRPEDHNFLFTLEEQGPTIPNRPSLRTKRYLPNNLPPLGEVPRSGDGGAHRKIGNNNLPPLGEVPRSGDGGAHGNIGNKNLPPLGEVPRSGDGGVHGGMMKFSIKNGFMVPPTTKSNQTQNHLSQTENRQPATGNNQGETPKPEAAKAIAAAILARVPKADPDKQPKTTRQIHVTLPEPKKKITTYIMRGTPDDPNKPPMKERFYYHITRHFNKEENTIYENRWEAENHYAPFVPPWSTPQQPPTPWSTYDKYGNDDEDHPDLPESWND